MALAEGALTLVDEEDFVVLDIGSRDTKFVQIKKGRSIIWTGTPVAEVI